MLTKFKIPFISNYLERLTKEESENRKTIDLVTGYSERNEVLYRSLEFKKHKWRGNVYDIDSARYYEPITREMALEFHASILESIKNWDQWMISELRQFAIGTRAGWKQAGLITNGEFLRMQDEIDEAVYYRLEKCLRVNKSEDL
ncbi:MAG: hypothetical protein ACK5NC_14955 [Vibrio sp.]